MKFTVDDPTLADVDNEIDLKPSVEYVLTERNGFVCDLTLNGIDCTSLLDIFEQNEFHSVFVVDPFHVERCGEIDSREIVAIKGDVNNRICIVDIGNPAEIETICDLAVKGGATACIVKSFPKKLESTVPVFLVPVCTLQKMTLNPDAQVNIQRKQHKSDPEEWNDSDGTRMILHGSETMPINLVDATESHPLVGERAGYVDVSYPVKNDSSEYGLSVPLYTVTLFMNSYDNHCKSPKKLELVASSFFSEIVTTGEKFEAIWISEDITGNKNNNRFNKENMKGRVCVYSCTDAKKVTDVRDKASKCNAIALFAVGKTLTESTFPVFTVDDSVAEEIFHAKSTDVMFDLHDLPVADVENRQERSMNEYIPVADAGDCNATIPELSSYDKREKEPLESEIDYSIENSTENVRPSYAHVARSLPDDGRTFFGAIGGAVGGAIVEAGGAITNLFRSKKGPFLKDNSDVFLCYKQAFGKMESMDVPEAVANGQKFIEWKAHSICLGHFTALAYLCNKSLNECLIRELVHCLVHYKPSRDDSEFLKSIRKSKHDTWCLPQNVLYRFLVNNVHHWATCDEKTTLWKGIVLLTFSGLVRRPIDWSELASIRNAVDSSIFVTHKEAFVSVLDEDTLTTVTFLFQRNFDHFMQVYATQKKPRETFLHVQQLQMLFHLVKVQLHMDISSATSMWHQLSDDYGKFGKKNTMAFFMICIETIGFESIDAVNVWSELVSSVVQSKTCHIDCIFTAIEEALIPIIFTTATVSISSIDLVLHVYKSPLEKCVRDPKHFDCLKEYTAAAMKSGDNCGRKLVILDLTYKKVNDTMDSPKKNTGRADALIRECLVLLLEHRGTCFPSLCVILDCAVSEPDITFLNSVKDETMTSISSNLARRCLPEIKRRPVVLRDLPDVPVEAPKFIKMIIQSLQNGLMCSYKCIVEATAFYVEVLDIFSIDSSPAQRISQTVQRISQTVFHSCLVTWEPKAIVEITPKYKLTMDVLFSDSFQCKDDPSDHRTLIQHLVLAWISAFCEGKVSAYRFYLLRKQLKLKHGVASKNVQLAIFRLQRL